MLPMNPGIPGGFSMFDTSVNVNKFYFEKLTATGLARLVSIEFLE